MGFEGLVRSIKISPDLQVLLRGAAPTFSMIYQSLLKIYIPRKSTYCYGILQVVVDNDIVSSSDGKPGEQTSEILGGAKSFRLLVLFNLQKFSHVKDLDIMVDSFRTDDGVIVHDTDFY